MRKWHNPQSRGYSRVEKNLSRIRSCGNDINLSLAEILMMKKTALSRVRSRTFDLSTTIQSISRSWPGSNGRSFLIVDFFIDRNRGPHAFSHRNYGHRTNESPIIATSLHRPWCAACGDIAIIGDSFVLKLQSYYRGVKSHYLVSFYWCWRKWWCRQSVVRLFFGRFFLCFFAPRRLIFPPE